MNVRMNRCATIRRSVRRISFLLVVSSVLTAVPAYAASPWEDAVNALQVSFTGPIARGLSLVAIVVGGLMFAFGEGESKRCWPASCSASGCHRRCQLHELALSGLDGDARRSHAPTQLASCLPLVE